MTFPGRGLVVPVAAVITLLGAPVARAQLVTGEDDSAVDAGGAAPERERAQDLLRQGNEHFRSGHFAEALRAYRRAHELFPSPKLFFNIARCEESMGHRPQAMVNLRAFVRQVADSDPAVRADAERRIAALERALARVDTSALPPNAAVAVDGQGVGLTPLVDVPWLEPGAHAVTVDRAGKPPWVTTVEGQAGATVALRIPEPELTSGSSAPPAGGPEGTPPPLTTAPGSWHSHWWVWAGIGVLLAGATTTVLVLKLRCQQTTCE